MTMTGSLNTVLTHSAANRTRKEAAQERAGASKFFEKQETARHKKTLAELGAKARGARAHRRDERQRAKSTCAANLAETKTKNKDKPPHRRRAEIAKTRTDCAFDIMNVEEQAAQTLEQVEAERAKEVGYRRSSRIATKNNRKRDKERAGRVTAREQREEAFDQVRNDLDPDLLPYFEEIKDSRGFKDLCAAGRMTPTEAVLHMAQEAPEQVFAALERYAERELQREIERYEQEGGRVGAESERDTTGRAREESAREAKRAQPRSRQPSARRPEKPRSTATRAATTDDGPKSGTRRKRAPKAPSSATTPGPVESAPAQPPAPSATEPPRDAPVAPSADRTREGSTHADRSQDAEPARRGDSTAERELVSPPVRLVDESVDRPAPLQRWVIARRLGEQVQRVTRELRGEQVPYFRELLLTLSFRDYIDMGKQSLVGATKSMIAQHPAEVLAAFHRAVAAGRFPDPAELAGPHARAELERARTAIVRIYGANSEQASRVRELDDSAAPEVPAARSAKVPTRRLSPEERTLWIPETEPVPAPEPAPPPRTTLFDDDETVPETPEAKRRKAGDDDADSSKKAGKDPYVQQAFGAGYTGWLDRTDGQLTLDAAPARAKANGAPTSATSIQRPPEPAAPSVASPSSISLGTPPSVAATTAVAATTSTTAIASSPTAAAPEATARKIGGATLHEDRATRVLQVHFERMPPAPTRVNLRRAGFQWQARVQQWQAPWSEGRRSQAEKLLRELAFHQGQPRRGSTGILRSGAALEAIAAEEASAASDPGAETDGGNDSEVDADAPESGVDLSDNSRAISADDPNAIPKLQARIEEKRNLIRRAGQINDVLRNARARSKTTWEPFARDALARLGLTPSEVEVRVTRNRRGRYGVSGSEVQGLQNEIRRLERRIENLQQRDAKPARAPERLGPAVVSEDRTLNRVQVRFDTTPPEAVRRAFRARGFVWAPSNGAWQRQLKDSAWWRAQQILKEHYGDELETPPPLPASPPPEGKSDAERKPSTDAEPVIPAPAPQPVEATVAPEPTAGETPCEEQKGGLCLGASVYAVSELKIRDGATVGPGAEGVVLDVNCEKRGPCLFLVKWGSKAASWHDALEISTDPSVPF